MEMLIKIQLKDPSKRQILLEHDPKRRLEYVIPFAGDKFIAMYLEDVHVSYSGRIKSEECKSGNVHSAAISARSANS